MQRLIVAGNWKMHGDRAMVDRYSAALRGVVGGAHAEVWLFPPAIWLERFVAALAGSSVELGVQNIHAEASGAYTGEASVGMAKDAGARLVLVGHSERRALFGESDADVAAKTQAVLAAGLQPVVCVGESLDERQAGEAEAVVSAQLDAVLAPMTENDRSRLVVAYEPVWAIGTGETATPQIAQAMHAVIRARLIESGAGSDVPLLYGGSVKPSNAGELFAQEDINGALVGGASLDENDFGGIIAAAERLLA